jgi:hypothetical protein
MPFLGRCCFFDVSSVVKIVPGGVRFSNMLPGHLGDLFATHGSLVGLAFSRWVERLPEGADGLRKVLYGEAGMPPLRIVSLDEDDPMASLWETRMRMSLDLSRCAFYLGVDDSRMERVARDAGIGNLRTFDMQLID